MNPTTKLKPYSPAYTLVHNTHTYRKFLITRPKHLQTLRISRIESADDNSKTIRAIRIHIKNLTKNTKKLHHLDLTNLPHEQIPFNHHKDMLKKFKRIHKFSHIFSQKDQELILLNYIYLKRLKNLKALFLKTASSFIDFSDRFGVIPPQRNKILTIFLKLLNKIKLNQLQLRLKENKGLVMTEIIKLSQYPSSLQDFTFSCNDCLETIQDIDHLNNYLNLSHLHRLQKLKLLTQLSPDLLNQALGSVQNLDLLETLAFNITNKEGDLPEETKLLLAKCQGLENLHVISDSWIDVFNPNWRLKKLNLRIEIPEREHLDQLRNFLNQQQASLESLTLQLFFQKDPNLFIKELNDLLEEFAKLKKLKMFRLNFGLANEGLKSNPPSAFPSIFGGLSSQKKTTNETIEVTPLPILPALISALNSLENLKELSLGDIQVEFSSQIFEEFFKAIESKSSTLEKLELNLQDYPLQKRDFEIFSRALLRLTSLEALSLKKLSFGHGGLCELFANVIIQISKLMSLKLLEMKFKAEDQDPQDAFQMCEIIFLKPNLHTFHFREDWKVGLPEAFKSCEKLSIVELYQKNPQNRSFRMPMTMTKMELPNRWKGI